MRPLPALLAALLLAAPAAAHAAGGGAGAAGGMARVPGGTYRPLYGRAGDPPVAVAAFRLDRAPATRGEFLAFVRANPEWRRGQVRGVFADRRAYLAGWPGELDAGGPADLARPVTGVSWFAARAYCAWRGKRLPTVHEWEYAAAAGERRRDAAREPGFVQPVLALYTTRPRPLPPLARAGAAGRPNAYGVRGLHGLAWEWTADFNSVLVSDDSRGVGGRDHDLFCASAAVGAADPTNYPAFLRFAVRAGLTGRSAAETLGVRCAA